MDVAKQFKYFLDWVFGCLLLALLSPLLVLIALVIRFDSPGHPLFLQERVGEKGESFTIFKFRTMRENAENQGLGNASANDDERITKVGGFLRRSSLDELPQLLNIVLREMSFIGPRPTLRYQVDSYTAAQRRRLLFRPGITGWAQVNGRNTIPWKRRIELDVEYVDRYTVWLDVKIVLKTLVILTRSEGVYAEAGAPNDDFVSSLDSPRVAAPAIDSQQATQPGENLAREEILLIGSGGHARVVIDAIEKQGLYGIVGIIDDGNHPMGSEVMGYSILGDREVLAASIHLPRRAFVAIGSGLDRSAWHSYLETAGLTVVQVTHPTAIISRNVILGAGTFAAAGAIINAGTRIGKGVILNTACSVDHDCIVEDFAHISPGARLAGNVHIGSRTHVGISACIVQGIDVADDVTIGAGAAVVRNVGPRRVVAGVPARPLVKTQAGGSRSLSPTHQS